MLPHKGAPPPFGGDSLKLVAVLSLPPLAHFSRHSLKTCKKNRLSADLQRSAMDPPPYIPTPLRSTTGETSDSISPSALAAAAVLSEDESSSEGSALGDRLSKIGASHSLVPTARNEEKPASQLSDSEFSFTLLSFINSLVSPSGSATPLRSVPDNISALAEQDVQKIQRDLLTEQLQLAGARGFYEYSDLPLNPDLPLPADLNTLPPRRPSDTSSLASERPGPQGMAPFVRIPFRPVLGPSDAEVDLLREKLKLAGARGFLDPGGDEPGQTLLSSLSPSTSSPSLSSS